MAGSFQNEIPPARVNLRLDVGAKGAKKKVELPLRLLVLGDFSNGTNSASVADRLRIAVDRSTFPKVMGAMVQVLEYPVEDKLNAEGGTMKISLPIENLESFRPENVVAAVPRLSRLLAARNLLRDLKSNIVDNRELRRRLEAILHDAEASQRLNEQLKRLIADYHEEESQGES